MTAALISFGSTILAILLVSAIRTEGRLSRLEAKLDVIMAQMLPTPSQQQVEAQQPIPAATPPPKHRPHSPPPHTDFASC